MVAQNATGKNFLNKLRNYIRSYHRNYRNGVDKFGVWWKVFQFSLWSLSFIFLMVAIIVIIVYLPKVELLHFKLV
jgi:hypothetical protein